MPIQRRKPKGKTFKEAGPALKSAVDEARQNVAKTVGNPDVSVTIIVEQGDEMYMVTNSNRATLNKTLQSIVAQRKRL